MTSSFSIWKCVLNGYFERGIIWRAKSRLKGIEDFDLEYCACCRASLLMFTSFAEHPIFMVIYDAHALGLLCKIYTLSLFHWVIMKENLPNIWRENIRIGFSWPLYTMHHGRRPYSMVWLDGPTFMVWFVLKSIHKVFGPLIRNKPNVDQEEWPCTKNECADFLFFHMSKEGNFERKRIQVWPFSCLLFSSFSLPWALPFSTTTPLLPFPPQNLLDQVCRWCRP